MEDGGFKTASAHLCAVGKGGRALIRVPISALTVSIERMPVKWMLDADIRGFVGNVDPEWVIKFVQLYSLWSASRARASRRKECLCGSPPGRGGWPAGSCR